MKKNIIILFFIFSFLGWDNFAFGLTQTYNMAAGNLVGCSSAACGTGGPYNNCSGGQIGFSWGDILPGGSTVTSVSIQFVIGVECSPGTDNTYLNGVFQGTFTDFSNGCSCNYTGSNGITTINAAIANYVVGGANTFLITPGISCMGFYPNWAGPVYGIITVNYTTCTTISAFPWCESFDGATFAPSCWANTQISGAGLWQRSTGGANPACSMHSGAGMAYFNSYSYSSGTEAILVTPALNTTGSYAVNFWMYRDNGYLGNADLINVYYNTAPNKTGATFLGTINRSINLAPVVGANGWYQYNYSLPSNGNLYVIFDAVSAYGNNIFIDDICVQSACAAPSISVQPISQIVCAGSGVTFSVTAAGTGLTYQWRKNGVNIGGATGSSYTIASVVVGDAASAPGYDCVITGTCGSVTSSAATLTVDAVPVQGSVSNAGPIDFCDAGGNWSAVPISVSGSTGIIWWQFGWSSGGWSGDWVSGTSPAYCCFPKKVAASDGNADRIRWYVKSANGACSATAYSSAILLRNHYNEAPTSLTASSSFVCNATVVTLTANFPTNIDILGTVEFATSCGGVPFATVTAGNNVNSVATTVTPPVGATTYYARYNPGAGTGCSATTCASITITVNQQSANPTSASASVNPICNGGVTNLILTGGGGGTGEVINWYTGSCGGTFLGSGNNLPVNPSSTTTYYGRYEDPAPCSFNTSCQQVTVTVNNCPVAVQVVFPAAGPKTYITISNGTIANGGTYFVVGNPAANAVINGGNTGGWMISENQYNYLQWQNITATNSYVIPFGYSTSDYLPFTFGKTAGAASDLIVSTWGTAAANNLPVAGATDVAAVSNMMDAVGTDETTGPTYHVIDRWWIINTTGTTANLSFTYRGQENTMTIPADILAIQHWNGTVWDNGNNGGTGSYVTTGTGGLQGAVPHTVTSGASTFSYFSPYVLVDKVDPLPVQWLDLSSECNHGEVTIKWSTATEQNSNYFTVERSLDGINFSSIAIVPAAGNSSTIKNYLAVDYDAYSGTSYYRITETDNNGKAMYSNLITINGCSGDDVVIYGAGADVSININATADDKYNIELYDVLGQKLISQVNGVTSGSNYIKLSPRTIAAAIYVVKVYNSKNSTTKKVFIRSTNE